uniref:Uncharacterized protein n=1 Tax=Myoviridae sp. ctCXW4 TaxID=2827669 RepID=A0A8S5TQ11_9CAUD|nr:MAG TPA: hypothetical protein [Myoviridae sp. ctCXW4]
MGLIPSNFTVLSEYHSCILHLFALFSSTCHTATLTNLLCYTPISQIQGKSAY